MSSQSNEQNNLVSTSSESKISNVGYMDSSGTTYFSPPSFITNTLNDINLYLSNTVSYNNMIENIDVKENVCNWTNNSFSASEFPTTLVRNFFFLLIILFTGCN